MSYVLYIKNIVEDVYNKAKYKKQITLIKYFVIKIKDFI